MIEVEENDIFDCLGNYNCVFFVGSAISMKAPSYLPDGNMLKRYVVEALCKDVDYLQQFSDYQTIDVNNSSQNLFKCMQELMPEVIFQVMQDIIGAYAIKALKFCDRANYNFNHKTLARILKRNRELRRKSIIITTNFDHLLEDALNEIGLNEPDDFLIHIANDDFLFSDAELIDIFKLHGTVQDDASIITTLSAIGLRLPDKKAHVLKTVLEKCMVFFVGYSGYDLDIYPIINGCDCKDIYWLMKPGAGITLQSSNLVKKFNAKIYKTDLNEMFIRLSEKFGFSIQDERPGKDDRFVHEYLSEWSKEIAISDRVHIIANIMRHIGQPNRSIDLLEKMRTLHENADPLKRTKYLTDLGAVYTDVNNWQKAEEAYNECLGIAEDNGMIVSKGISMSGLAYISYKRDMWNKAAALYTNSLNLLKNSQAEDRDILGIELGLGLTYYKP